MKGGDSLRSLTVQQTAKILNKSEKFVRQGLQDGRLPFGVAVKLKDWDYHISKKLLQDYIGDLEVEKKEQSSVEKDCSS